MLTAPIEGKNFHIYDFSLSSTYGQLNYVHLYTLSRGFTAAIVQNVSFSCDSKWVAVSTFNGTTRMLSLLVHAKLVVHSHTHSLTHSLTLTCILLLVRQICMRSTCAAAR